MKTVRVYKAAEDKHGMMCPLCRHIMEDGELIVALPIADDIDELQCYGRHPNIPYQDKPVVIGE